MGDDFVRSGMANDEAGNKDEVYSERCASDGGDSNSLYYVAPSSRPLKLGYMLKRATKVGMRGFLVRL